MAEGRSTFFAINILDNSSSGDHLYLGIARKAASCASSLRFIQATL
jgi:hypothetical protein